MNEEKIHQRASLFGEAVFAADDGLITTFAVVAGSAGAGLSPLIVLILGFANLFADGLSMATGRYLGVKTEMEYEKAEEKEMKEHSSPVRSAITTYLSFIIAGFLPLIPFLLGVWNMFLMSAVVVGVSLFAIGVLRSIFTRKAWLSSGLEVLLIGGGSAAVAYLVGFLVESYVGRGG